VRRCSDDRIARSPDRAHQPDMTKERSTLSLELHAGRQKVAQGSSYIGRHIDEPSAVLNVLKPSATF
jgi:hypothetical protein